MDMPPNTDIPRRRRRIAVLALRLNRFLPYQVPRQDDGPHRPVPDQEDHACSTELTSSCV